MVRRLLASMTCACAIFLPAASTAQDEAYFGPQVGLFFPADNSLRSALGDSWFSFGASRVRIFDLDQAKWAHDWQAISQRRNGNSVFILTGSVGFVSPFGQPGSDVEPYWAVRGGLSYFDYAIDQGGGRRSAKRFGFNGNAALGVNFSRRLNLEARYDVFNSFAGFNFNGLTLSLSYGIVRF